jgi:hypothetical protein
MNTVTLFYTYNEAVSTLYVAAPGIIFAPLKAGEARFNRR